MNYKYYYVKEPAAKTLHEKFDFDLEDLFLGIRSGCLLMIVFFLGYFVIKQTTYTAQIHSPLSLVFAVENTAENAVLGENTITNEQPLPTPTISPPLPTPTPSPIIITANKSRYSIAIFGDSMVDTMGERLEYLEKALKLKYPNTNFDLYNFGQGAQNVSDGLTRLHNSFDYQDRHYPSLDEIRPDIIIIGSFAYNPFSPHDRDRHWSTLTQLVEQARTISPRVYLLAEITPLRSDFGKGPGGVNWDNNTAFEHSGRIIEQLENTIGLAQTLNVPLINAFSPSGEKKEYVNSHDGIHPSVTGHQFMAEKIATTIKLD